MIEGIVKCIMSLLLLVGINVTKVDSKPSRAAVKRSTTTVPTTVLPPTISIRERREVGIASWYDYRQGQCAHKSIPKGTKVRVRANEREVYCTVTDRGPYIAGRIIDLDRRDFSKLAPYSSGTVRVEITW